MSLKKLHALKKSESLKETRETVKNLVVGSDLFSLEIYNHLKNEQNEDVKLLSRNELVDFELTSIGPNVLRGQENILCLKQVFPNFVIEELQRSSFFYKEQKFRKFGGRSKSEKLLFGEEFFIEKSASYSNDDFFKFITNQDFFSDLDKNTLTLLPTSIKRSESGWQIKCSDGTIVTCEKLFWGEDLVYFTEILSERETFNKGLFDYVASLDNIFSLFVKFHLNKKIYKGDSKTIFLPLSFTHDWGHFIGELETDNCEEGNSGTRLEFVHFIDKEIASEEELSKRIKILKRNLERIFPEFSISTEREEIVLKENSCSVNIDDALFDGSCGDNSNIMFFGPNAPLNDGFMKEIRSDFPLSKLSYFARGMLSVEYIKKDFARNV